MLLCWWSWLADKGDQGKGMGGRNWNWVDYNDDQESSDDNFSFYDQSFIQADLDGDGKLDYTEFTQMMLWDLED